MEVEPPPELRSFPSLRLGTLQGEKLLSQEKGY
jgi:hypothetical protein